MLILPIITGGSLITYSVKVAEAVYVVGVLNVLNNLIVYIPAVATEPLSV